MKHVIVLSDGNAPYDGLGELADDMRAARITVSAVGIGDADKNLLQLLSERGDGRLYMTDDLASLPRIFMKETTEAQKSILVEEPVTVRVNKAVEMIEGTGVASAPPLGGYVSTRAKPSSEVILLSQLGEPILARWRLGSGTSIAWTSDVKNRWSSEWIRWSGYPKFWAQVVRSSMRRKTYDSYELRASVEGGRARIIVDAIDANDRFVNELDTELEIIDPATSEVLERVPMVQSAAGRYAADVPLDRFGSFVVKAVHKRDGRTVAESKGAVSLPYPEEFLRSGPSLGPLRAAAELTGGKESPEPAELFDARSETLRHSKDLWPWVLLAVSFLLVLDTFLKRVRLFGHRTLSAPRGRL